LKYKEEKEALGFVTKNT